MSYRCEFCGDVVPPGKPAIKVVTKIRHRGANGYEWKGTEIAEEKNSCETCHDPDREPEILTVNPALNAVANPVLSKVA